MDEGRGWAVPIGHSLWEEGWRLMTRSVRLLRMNEYSTPSVNHTWVGGEGEGFVWKGCLEWCALYCVCVADGQGVRYRGSASVSRLATP